MDRQVELTSVARPEAWAVVVFEKTRELPEAYRKLDGQVQGALSAALKRPEFTGGRGEVLTLYPAGSVSRLYVLGLGDRGKFSAEALRIAAGKLLRAAANAKVGAVKLIVQPVLEKRIDAEAAGRALGDGLSLARFDFDQYKGTGSRKNGNGNGDAGGKSQPARVKIDVEPEFRAAAKRSLLIGESVNLTRRLAATPPNVAHPQYLVDFARKLARQSGLRCTIIDQRRARQLGMGGLLAVGAGGSHDPALICLEWRGKSAGRQRSDGPILLVGKAVTFDTGGYSIKPGENMDKMKYDKSAGCAVIGAMQAVARLKLPLHVVGLIPAAENMIDEDAYRPGDILTMFNGVTVEVTNTDAEGRLILGDALSYGCKTYKPAAVIDMATLTGGVVVALGTFCAGCFCNDDRFLTHLSHAGEFVGERLWRLPLWDEHKQMIKAPHGDILNAAGREAHPIQGAAFLSYFVGPDGKSAAAGSNQQGPLWAHIDIAGMSDVKKDTPLIPAGPTGFGVRLLIRTLETWPAFQKGK